jgi:hypothetical protein
MKRKCTPINNAITIKTPVTCPAPIVPTDVCVDPFTYVWNLAVQESLKQGISLLDSWTSLLGTGLVMPKGDDICCPSCTAAPFYSLTNITGFLTLAAQLGWTNTATEQIIDYCCINTHLSIADWARFNSEMNIDGVLPTCCSNNFSECITQLSAVSDISELQKIGVVETNHLGGESFICNLAALIQALPAGLTLQTDIVTMAGGILANGFVAYCCGCNIIITTTAQFVDVIDSGLCPDLINTLPQ